MRLKLDENIHTDVVEPLRRQGHEVATVLDQKLAGRPDADVAAVVSAEGYCLVTFDLDFADTRRHPPVDYAGLVVLRLRVPTARNQADRITRFFGEKPEVTGHLWIVEENRARDWTP